MQGETLQLEHLGIVAEVIREIGLVEKIDNIIGLPNADISPGQRVASMILNCLGFVNHPLYLSEKFFSKRPVEKLLGSNVTAEKLNDDCLGRGLDLIHDYGEDKFFSQVALQVVRDLGQLGPNFKLDSTSFSLTGQYKTQSDKVKVSTIPDPDEDSDGPQEVLVTHGYSKDHRPDLKQIMMAMVTSGPADFPVMMLPQSGNASDRAEFAKVIQAQVRKLQKQFQVPDMMWAADSALYNTKWVETQKQLGVLWVTRSPNSLTMAKRAIAASLAAAKDQWATGSNGYHFFESTGDHGGEVQRLVVVRSEQASEQQLKTFDRNLEKKRLELEKKIAKLNLSEFKCATDAEKALMLVVAKEKEFDLCDITTTEILKFSTRGRPKAGQEPDVVGYQVNAKVCYKLAPIQEKRGQKGFFVLVTNALNQETYKAEDVLTTYKGLSGTERGFRFLKDPLFMADQFYLKKPSRITALMCVMTLSLMIYKLVQHKIRQACKQQNQRVPNHAGKPVNQPTSRLVFQHFTGASVIRTFDKGGTLLAEFMETLNSTQTMILRLLGPPYEAIYAINA